jgi:hypothetical protein
LDKQKVQEQAKIRSTMIANFEIFDFSYSGSMTPIELKVYNAAAAAHIFPRAFLMPTCLSD